MIFRGFCIQMNWYLLGVAGAEPYALNVLLSSKYKNYSTLFTFLFAGTVDSQIYVIFYRLNLTRYYS